MQPTDITILAAFFRNQVDSDCKTGSKLDYYAKNNKQTAANYLALIKILFKCIIY
jgi:hypothetical protein